MTKAGVGQHTSRRLMIVIVDENAAWDDTQRAFDNAHVIVEQKMIDVGTIQQRANGGNQNDVVGS